MYINTLKRESRMLRNYGIVWKHLKYNNKGLMKIYSHIGTGKELDILIDKRDIRRIWVIDPKDEKPISVELASAWASTFHEYMVTYQLMLLLGKEQCKILNLTILKK